VPTIKISDATIMMKQLQYLTFSALLAQWAKPTRTFTSSSQIIPNRSYSSSSSHELVPVKVYSNPDIDKEKVIEENKGKSGVYR
jgi:hypothetical protein